MSNPFHHRRKNALGTLLGYRKAKGESMAGRHAEDRESELSDLLADVMHLAHSLGYDRAAITRRAVSNVDSELFNLEQARAQGLTGADLAAAVES